MLERMTTAEQYRSFASMDAHGRSPLYEELAYGVAGDRDLIEMLSQLPPAKRQPNLLFAAARHIAGTPAGYPQFRQSVLDNRHAVIATMLARRTQTNEPARCAALYPLLASLPQPLALHDRLQRLNTAIAVAQSDPPRIVRGDLNARLAEAAALASSYATLVVVDGALVHVRRRPSQVRGPGRTPPLMSSPSINIRSRPARSTAAGCAGWLCRSHRTERAAPLRDALSA